MKKYNELVSGQSTLTQDGKILVFGVTNAINVLFSFPEIKNMSILELAQFGKCIIKHIVDLFLKKIKVKRSEQCMSHLTDDEFKKYIHLKYDFNMLAPMTPLEWDRYSSIPLHLDLDSVFNKQDRSLCP